MNCVILYTVWQKNPQQMYEFHSNTTSLDEARRLCTDQNGQFIYTFAEAWYGEQ